MRLNNIKSQVSTITSCVRWWCGSGAVGTARDGKVSSWQGGDLAVGNCKSPNQDVRIHTPPESYSGQTVFCFVLFQNFFLKYLSEVINFSILGGTSAVAISHVSFHAKRQRPFFVSCFLFFVFVFPLCCFVRSCLFLPFFNFPPGLAKQLMQTVRWWCGGGAVGTTRVGKASGWRLAVGGWLARWRSGGGELKKPNQDVRIHTAPEL